MQSNIELLNHGPRAQGKDDCDIFSERMLQKYAVLYKRMFFQDLPFLWHENPNHPLFSRIPFFTKHKEVCGGRNWVLLHAQCILVISALC